MFPLEYLMMYYIISIYLQNSFKKLVMFAYLLYFKQIKQPGFD